MRSFSYHRHIIQPLLHCIGILFTRICFVFILTWLTPRQNKNKTNIRESNPIQLNNWYNGIITYVSKITMINNAKLLDIIPIWSSKRNKTKA